MSTPSTSTGRSLPWIFPAAYLSVTQSSTALIVAVGLIGDPTLAADIALAQGAAIATFHALSANARNLVLGQSRALSIGTILRMRLALVVPLAAVAYFLAVGGAGVAPWLALVIVTRRSVDWFSEILLCKAEVDGHRQFAAGFLGLQGFLFAVAAIALVVGWDHAALALGVWALAPALLTLTLRGLLFERRAAGALLTLRKLLPHAGSTAISGLALYAFRVVVVLMLARELAGELFAAIAIGSFLGTAFANVIGPSVELHQQRTGRGLPHSIWLVLLGAAGLGLVFTLGSFMIPAGSSALGKAPFFWLACGLSLIGGVVMVAAQRVKLRVMRADDGRDVFGPEVLIHVGLLVAAPLLIRFFGPPGAATLYFVTAILAYVFYRSSEIAQLRADDPSSSGWTQLRFVLGFFLVFPLFFVVSGKIYNDPNLMIDSGGLLAKLPLPASLLALCVGLVLLSDFRRATRSFTFILIFFTGLLASAVITAPVDDAFSREKLLLLIQFLLPVIALAMGEMFETDAARRSLLLERAFFWACVAIIPAQLVASWSRGQVTLTYWLGLFSVYQHLQYVPVILGCAVLTAAPALRENRVYRGWIFALMTLSVVYALAAYSLLAIFVASAGLVVAAVRFFPGIGLRKALATTAIGMVVIGAQYALLQSSAEYRANAKLVTVDTLTKNLAVPCSRDVVIHLSPLVARQDKACVLTTIKPRVLDYLMGLNARQTVTGDALNIAGELRRGTLIISLVRENATVAKEQRVNAPGHFSMALAAEPGKYIATLTSASLVGENLDASVTRFEWSARAGIAETTPIATIVTPLTRLLPMNLVERVSDWLLFGRPIFASAETFLFGHPKPLERSVRSSAHNYYIDLAYNFGAVAVLPILALLAYTVRLIWVRRRDVWRSDRLFWLAGVVMFLIVVDSNFKVTLRQPYPGIFAFFAWGILLSRLRLLSNTQAPSDGADHHRISRRVTGE